MIAVSDECDKVSDLVNKDRMELALKRYSAKFSDTG